MSNIRVTQEQIDSLINTAEITTETIYDKITVVTVKLANGFCISEASGAVDPENYSEKIGKDICLERIKNKLWELEGYALQKAVDDQHRTITITDFGWAMKHLKSGDRLRRRGWNGKGIFIELQRPDEHSKMTSPYIYIDTSGLQTNNPDAPKSRVPWFPSQTDLLADDWEVFV